MKDVEVSIGRQVSADMSRNNKNRGKKKLRKRRRRRRIIAVSISLFALILLAGVFFFHTSLGKKLAIRMVSNKIYDSMNYVKSSKDNNAKNKDGKVQSSVSKEFAAKKIYNIALIGRQSTNTDTMMIATLNTKENTLTLTSLMRDIYVDIPGHQSAKLNSAYSQGGIDLFYQTINQNFGVSLDGYALVDYSAFEYIIDRIGGVEITLTPEEAQYLNTTNYISKRQYRNVKAGTQILNGNQALGFSRIRKRPTIDNEHDDFGRTSRQRTVLKQVYKQLKSKNIVNLVSIMNDVMKKSDIKTDITRDEFNFYLSKAVDLKMTSPKTYRIPSNNTYECAYRRIGRLNLSVLIIKDWEATRNELNNIIYGARQE